MKKIKLLFLSFILLAGMGYAQNKVAEWPQMKAFHSIMAATFHPADEGNLQPLKEKADSLYLMAKKWVGSPVPPNYKTKELRATLQDLMIQCNGIAYKVKSNAPDAELKTLITKAHETFHKIVDECKKSDGAAH